MQLTRGHRTQAHVAMRFAVLLSFAGLSLGVSPNAAAAKKPEKLSFDMVVSAGAKNCLPDAKGHVTIRAAGDNQRMPRQQDVQTTRRPSTAITLRASRC